MKRNLLDLPYIFKVQKSVSYHELGQSKWKIYNDLMWKLALVTSSTQRGKYCNAFSGNSCEDAGWLTDWLTDWGWCPKVEIFFSFSNLLFLLPFFSYLFFSQSFGWIRHIYNSTYTNNKYLQSKLTTTGEKKRLFKTLGWEHSIKEETLMVMLEQESECHFLQKSTVCWWDEERRFEDSLFLTCVTGYWQETRRKGGGER